MNFSNFFQFMTLFCSVFFVQCTKDDPQSCLYEPKDVAGTVSNCDSFPIFMNICEHSYGGKLVLNDLSKEYLPWYCDEKGSIRKFENNAGQTIEFTLVQKYHITSLSLLNTFKVCSSDSTQFIGMCIHHEVASTQWMSSEPDMNFHINITSRPEFLEGALVGYGDYLQISRFGDVFSRLEFLCIIHQNTLSSPSVFGQRFYELLDLEGRKYTNILTVETSWGSSDSFTYWYHKHRGLVAFRDNNKVIWHLID